NSIHFQLNCFDPIATDIVCEGDVVPSVGEIEFNKVNYINWVGWAVYAQRVRIWDSGTKKLTDFTTHYSFIIDTQGSKNYGHGLVFFLAPLDFDIPRNSSGGFLGLFNTTTSESPKNQIVTVEFDSFVNTGWDPLYEHVGINNNSISSIVTTPWNASLHSRDTTNVWITYNASTQNLSVFWSYDATPTPPVNSSLCYRIDLREVVSEWVKVGFSATTAEYRERHRLKSWEWVAPPTVAPLLLNLMGHAHPRTNIPGLSHHVPNISLGQYILTNVGTLVWRLFATPDSFSGFSTLPLA
ncbi:unnamed protein product, partial [Thlaspi arvense]